MKQLYFFIALSLLTLLKVQAQSDFRAGFIINQHGDTLQGMIKYNGERQNAEFCQFKREGTENIEDLTAKDIQYYSFTNDRQYVSKKIISFLKERFYFLELVVKGKVSLYFFRDAKESQHFYIEKDGLLPLTELTIDHVQSHDLTFERKTYVNILLFALKEANFSKRKIETTDLFRHQLTKLIEEYNQKVFKNNLVWVMENPRKNKTMRIRPGFYIGLTTNSYLFNSQPVFFTGDKFGPAKGLSVSFFTNLYFHYWKKSFISVQPEINYSTSTVHVLYSYKGQDLHTVYQLNYLKFPVNLKFEIGKQSAKLIPFATAGAFLALHLSNEVNTSGATFYDTADKFYKIIDEQPRAPFGLNATVGLDYKINANNRLSLEARFEVLPAKQMNFYYGESISEAEYQNNRDKYSSAAFYDNYIFTKLEHQFVKSSIQTATVRIGFRF